MGGKFGFGAVVKEIPMWTELQFFLEWVLSQSGCSCYVRKKWKPFESEVERLGLSYRRLS